MYKRWVAVLGWRDEPTDAVLEYCEYLRDALEQQGIVLELFRVRWPELGWRRALAELHEKVASSSGAWFILQYTALTWSRRGFSWRALSVLRVFKKNGVRCAIVFHDSEGYPGSRVVDLVRRFVQVRVMLRLQRLTDVAILNIPPENAPWLPAGSHNTVLIPVGANLSSPEIAWNKPQIPEGQLPSVAIFSLSVGRVGEEEAQTIADAASYTARKLGGLQLVLFGRNSEAGALQLKEKLAGTSVQIEAHGLLPADDIVRVLSSCNAMLFVRGPISSRRGSAIAGIACGLPIVASKGWETGWPITEAGLELLPSGEMQDYGPALVRVLSDRAYATALAERSRQAYSRYFAWTAIATQYREALGEATKPTAQ